MTSKIIVNNIEADTGVSSVTFNSTLSASAINATNLTGTNVTNANLQVTGNVGIGTTDPQAPFGGRALQLGNISDARSVFTLQSSTTGRNSIYFSDDTAGGGTYRGYIDYIHSDNVMVFGVETTERARITNAGFFKASNSGSYHNSTGDFHEFRQTISNAAALVATASDSSYVGNLIHASATRAATNAYSLLKLESSTFTDAEFNFAGNGNAFADGTFSGGGADYAEFFEWCDSNLDNEDRRGISVVLNGDKIREAIAGEDPIGVISGNPSVVGDAAWNKWSGKYLRDEFGSYVLDEDGYRQLNPAFDPDADYIPREQRPEWDCVGLMGKLRIRKGQITGSRWIKMRDVSDNVEEWLIR